MERYAAGVWASCPHTPSGVHPAAWHSKGKPVQRLQQEKRRNHMKEALGWASDSERTA